MADVDVGVDEANFVEAKAPSVLVVNEGKGPEQDAESSFMATRWFSFSLQSKKTPSSTSNRNSRIPLVLCAQQND
jgi:hypothetical protein